MFACNISERAWDGTLDPIKILPATADMNDVFMGYEDDRNNNYVKYKRN